MAINDIELNAGVNIAEIKGADKLADVITDSIVRGMSASERLAKKRDEFASLYGDIKTRGRAASLEDALYNRRLYNKALGTSYEKIRSEEVTRELEMLREGNRLTISGSRSESRMLEQVAARKRVMGLEDKAATERYLESMAKVEAMQESGDAYRYRNREEYLNSLFVAREDLQAAYRASKAAETLTDEDRKNYYHDIRNINKEIKRLNRGLPKFIDDYKVLMAYGATGVAFGGKMSSMVAGVYGDMNTPFSKVRDIGNQVAKGIGGTLGTILGGLIGGPVGAVIGGAAGSFIGGTGERTKAAADAAKPQAIAMLRYRGLYGNRIGTAGYNAALMAEKAGYASASDIMGMASGSNTFMASAAFGGISEQQWLALSMMPNYYNALVSGASVEEQMAAYAQDMNVLGSGMGQYMTGLLGGLGPNENIRAFVQSDSFARFLSDYPQFAEWEREQLGYAKGYAGAQYKEGIENMRVRNFNMWRGTQTISGYNFEGGNIMDRIARYDEMIRGPERKNPVPFSNSSLVQRELNIIIDGEKLNVGTVYAAEEDLHNYMTYSAGGR